MITWGGVLTTVIATLGAFGGAAAIATVVAKWVSDQDRKSTRLNSSHIPLSRMPSSS